MLERHFMVYDGNTSTMWTEDDEWIQIESRSPWKSCFVLFPHKSYFSSKFLWGENYKRTAKFMIRGTKGSAPRNVEYATHFEVFKDKLKGAL